jgi:ribonuclease PH
MSVSGSRATSDAPGRPDGRGPGDLRPIRIDVGFIGSADGSALIALGDTRVICTASLVEGVPSWREGSGGGWLTAEYGMLPASTGSRRQRDATRGRPDGRTVEIQRLIGRSLRAVIDLDALGERTVYLDCDVIEADGGTRCAGITGAYVALKLALAKLVDQGKLSRLPLRTSVAAVSCGVVDGVPLLDLSYVEDSAAEVDMNVVMTGTEELVEVQATGEGVAFPRAVLDRLLELAAAGIVGLGREQEKAAGALA